MPYDAQGLFVPYTAREIRCILATLEKNLPRSGNMIEETPESGEPLRCDVAYARDYYVEEFRNSKPSKKWEHSYATLFPGNRRWMFDGCGRVSVPRREAYDLTEDEPAPPPTSTTKTDSIDDDGFVEPAEDEPPTWCSYQDPACTGYATRVFPSRRDPSQPCPCCECVPLAPDETLDAEGHVCHCVSKSPTLSASLPSSCGSSIKSTPSIKSTHSFSLGLRDRAKSMMGRLDGEKRTPDRRRPGGDSGYGSRDEDVISKRR